MEIAIVIPRFRVGDFPFSALLLSADNFGFAGRVLH